MLCCQENSKVTTVTMSKSINRKMFFLFKPNRCDLLSLNIDHKWHGQCNISPNPSLSVPSTLASWHSSPCLQCDLKTPSTYWYFSSACKFSNEILYNYWTIKYTLYHKRFIEIYPKITNLCRLNHVRWCAVIYNAHMGKLPVGIWYSFKFKLTNILLSTEYITYIIN